MNELPFAKRRSLLRFASLVFVLSVLGCGAEPSSRGAMQYAGSGAAPAAGQGGGSGASTTDGSGGNGFGNPETLTGGGAGAAGAIGTGGGPMETCAQGMATATPVTPNVWLVLDGSSSMNEPFGTTGTRWQTLRSTLMDPGGIVETLQGVVRFGMVIYSGADALAGGAECVKLVTVEPALDNYATLLAQYPADPIGMGTPTHKAVEHVVNNLPVLNEQVLDMNIDPTFVVLATDGAPNDRCMGDSGGGGGGNDFDEVTAGRVIDVVGAGVTKGVKLLVISLAGGDDDLQSHLEEVAELSGTGYEPFVPSTRDELINTMQELIGGAGCQVVLQGTVPLDQACTGEVTLNGNPLLCDDDNGYRLIDERTVQLEGEACTAFLSADSFVNARFPCGVFSPD